MDFTFFISSFWQQNVFVSKLDVVPVLSRTYLSFSSPLFPVCSVWFYFAWSVLKSWSFYVFFVFHLILNGRSLLFFLFFMDLLYFFSCDSLGEKKSGHAIISINCHSACSKYCNVVVFSNSEIHFRKLLTLKLLLKKKKINKGTYTFCSKKKISLSED